MYLPQSCHSNSNMPDSTSGSSAGEWFMRRLITHVGENAMFERGVLFWREGVDNHAIEKQIKLKKKARGEGEEGCTTKLMHLRTV